ncbi:unnamed protein product, partial [Urochloa humidicola]
HLSIPNEAARRLRGDAEETAVGKESSHRASSPTTSSSGRGRCCFSPYKRLQPDAFFPDVLTFRSSPATETRLSSSAAILEPISFWRMCCK